jgi:hypothetical protein
MLLINCPNLELKKQCFRLCHYKILTSYASDKVMKIHDNIMKHVPNRKLNDENDYYNLKDFNYYYDKKGVLRSLVTVMKFFKKRMKNLSF